MTGQVFAVASGKGGVGKTTTVVNLGVTIRADDHSVALVDADLGMANLATVLGIEHEPTLHDVLAGRAETEEAIVEQADRFAIVPGSRDLHGFAEADPTRLRDVIDDLAERYDYVIIDTGAGLSHEDLLPLGLADQVLLITTPDPSSVGDTRKVAGFSDILGKAVRGLVVTKSRTQSDADVAADEFDTELLATIPDDPTVVESTAKGVPLEVFDPETPAASAYRKLAKKVTGESITAEHMPDELEEPTTRGDRGSSEEEDAATDAELEAETGEATEAASVVPEDDPMATAADSSTEDPAAVEADPDVGETQEEEVPPSLDGAAEAEESDEVATEPFGTDLREAEDLLSAGEAADSDADAEEPSAIVEAPSVSETADETEAAEEPAVEPDDEAMEPSGEAEATENAADQTMEPPEPGQGEAFEEDDDAADADTAADESEAEEDETAPDEDGSEKSKGFFGRLFGVFR